MQIPYERVNRFMIRLTKGFLRYFYPRFNYNDLSMSFEPRLIDPSEDSLRFLESILPRLHSEERGAGVFRVWHGFTPTGSGSFFFMFYHHLLFFVPIIANPDSLKQGSNR